MNSSEWDITKTKINLYIHSAQNMTIYIGEGGSRDRIFYVDELKNITSTYVR